MESNLFVYTPLCDLKYGSSACYHTPGECVCVKVFLEKADKHATMLLRYCMYIRYQIVCSSVRSCVFVKALGNIIKGEGVDNNSSPICRPCFLSYSTLQSSTQHPHAAAGVRQFL